MLQVQTTSHPPWNPLQQSWTQQQGQHSSQTSSSASCILVQSCRSLCSARSSLLQASETSLRTSRPTGGCDPLFVIWTSHTISPCQPVVTAAMLSSHQQHHLSSQNIQRAPSPERTNSCGLAIFNCSSLGYATSPLLASLCARHRHLCSHLQRQMRDAYCTTKDDVC